MMATVAVLGACDKASDDAPPLVLPVGAPTLDLATTPQLLFQVFGDTSEPKLLPVAAVVGGAVQPIGLTLDGWRALDSTYFTPGAKYTVYDNDAVRGSVTVTRGMWNADGQANYPLPGCRDLKPLASVTLALNERSREPTVEFLASTHPLAPHRGAAAIPAQATIDRLGRQYGMALGLSADLGKEDLEALVFTARMMNSGAGKEPTLLVSFIDPQAGDVGPGMGHTSHILALFDKADTGYVATYRHVKSGEGRTVEFQRVVDHLDVDGDGIDEMLVESWHFGGNNELVVLGFKAGQWHEILRTSSKWCLDPPAKPADGAKP